MSLPEERKSKLYKDAYKEVKKQTGTLTVEQVTAVNIALDLALETLHEQLGLLPTYNSSRLDPPDHPDLVHITDVLQAMEA